ncbi:hypothetical protein, partial [Zobellia uliginosa]|uniref:hypothetical protein n=1 Tax=Zobellia uliginosa TaxID=143224 RepID=UPI0026E461E0
DFAAYFATEPKNKKPPTCVEGFRGLDPDGSGQAPNRTRDPIYKGTGTVFFQISKNDSPLAHKRSLTD